jgi:hypothetical protein
VVQIGHVTGHGQHAHALFAGGRGGCFERPGAAGGDGQVDAFGGEGAQDAQPDAGAGSGEDGGLAVDVDDGASIRVSG